MTPATERFILRWGEMGSRWGVNRSVAQVQAYLFVATEPKHAEDICNDLNLARSNVSTSLKELLSYRLVEQVPVKGDRRDYFRAETDPWEVMMRLSEARKQREIDPARAMLQQAVEEIRAEAAADPQVTDRLEGLDSLLEQMAGWYDQVKRLPKPVLRTLVKMGGKIGMLAKKEVA
jgi:DNA-binding transcriptional regulator GbsR (MarR family)